ncbi:MULTISPECIES: bluetail domain-containing putative surface protein [Microcystis]
MDFRSQCREFNAATDAIVEITGLTGTLDIANS